MYLYLRICNLYLYICIWIPPLLLLDPLLLTNLLLPQCASSVNSKHISTTTITIMFQLFNIAFGFHNCAGGFLLGLLVQLSDLIYMILGCIMRRERDGWINFLNGYSPGWGGWSTVDPNVRWLPRIVPSHTALCYQSLTLSGKWDCLNFSGVGLGGKRNYFKRKCFNFESNLLLMSCPKPLVQRHVWSNLNLET